MTLLVNLGYHPGPDYSPKGIELEDPQPRPSDTRQARPGMTLILKIPLAHNANKANCTDRDRGKEHLQLTSASA